MHIDAGRTDSASVVVSAPREEVYAAFASPDALMSWLPPENMTGRALEYDFRVGGRYRIELTYAADETVPVGKTTERTDVSTGRFLAIEPAKRIVQSVNFEGADPSLESEMVMTWSFEALATGTRITVTAENVPPGISKADHDAGLRSSLENLARFVSERAR